MAEYGYTLKQALNENITTANALLAVLMEKNGLVGVKTYRTHEYLKYLEKHGTSDGYVIFSKS